MRAAKFMNGIAKDYIAKLCMVHKFSQILTKIKMMREIEYWHCNSKSTSCENNIQYCNYIENQMIFRISYNKN